MLVNKCAAHDFGGIVPLDHYERLFLYNHKKLGNLRRNYGSLSEDHSTFTENETQASNPEVQPFKAPKHSMKRRPVVEDPRIAHALSIMDNVKKHDDEIFAAAVTAKLRKIRNERTKILVQRDIDNLWYDAIIGTGKYGETSTASPYSESSVDLLQMQTEHPSPQSTGSSRTQTLAPPLNFPIHGNNYPDFNDSENTRILDWQEL
nr:unnamed protein product [Callosobruchus chinensis]